MNNRQNVVVRPNIHEMLFAKMSAPAIYVFASLSIIIQYVYMQTSTNQKKGLATSSRNLDSDIP